MDMRVIRIQSMKYVVKHVYAWYLVRKYCSLIQNKKFANIWVYDVTLENAEYITIDRKLQEKMTRGIFFQCDINLQQLYIVKISVSEYKKSYKYKTIT